MLKIRLFSFSYLRSGIPQDNSVHGGGFVFDCRFIENPGTRPGLMTFTGKDKEVIDFLDSNKDMRNFLSNVFGILDRTIENYIERGYTELMVSFGCTGGQHRSVYAAEKTKQHIEEKFKNASVAVKHKDL